MDPKRHLAMEAYATQLIKYGLLRPFNPRRRMD
jgi:hypothetical protein